MHIMKNKKQIEYDSTDSMFINDINQNMFFYNINTSNHKHNAHSKENILQKNNKKKIPYTKPWMHYVDKYSLLSASQKESLDMYFLSNQVKLSRKNLRHISKELQISYKKIINYVYERDYDHLIVKEDFLDDNISDLKKIRKELEHAWKVYGEMAEYFRYQMNR